MALNDGAFVIGIDMVRLAPVARFFTDSDTPAALTVILKLRVWPAVAEMAACACRNLPPPWYFSTVASPLLHTTLPLSQNAFQPKNASSDEGLSNSWTSALMLRGPCAGQRNLATETVPVKVVMAARSVAAYPANPGFGIALVPSSEFAEAISTPKQLTATAARMSRLIRPA